MPKAAANVQSADTQPVPEQGNGAIQGNDTPVADDSGDGNFSDASSLSSDFAMEELESFFVSDNPLFQRRSVGVEAQLSPLDRSPVDDHVTMSGSVRRTSSRSPSPLRRGLLRPLLSDAGTSPVSTELLALQQKFEPVAVENLSPEAPRRKGVSFAAGTADNNTPTPSAKEVPTGGASATPPPGPANNAKFFRHNLPLLSQMAKDSVAFQLAGSGGTPPPTAGEGDDAAPLVTTESSAVDTAAYYVDVFDQAEASVSRSEVEAVCDIIVRCCWDAAEVEGHKYVPKSTAAAVARAARAAASEGKEGSSAAGLADVASVAGSVAPSAASSALRAQPKSDLTATPFAMNLELQELADGSVSSFSKLWSARKAALKPFTEPLGRKALAVMGVHLRQSGVAQVSDFKRFTATGSSYVSLEQGVVVHVWNCASEARRFMLAFQSGSQLLFEHGIPVIACPVSVLVASRGRLATATQLMPLARPVDAPPVSTSPNISESSSTATAAVRQEEALPPGALTSRCATTLNRNDTPITYTAASLFAAAIAGKDIAASGSNDAAKQDAAVAALQLQRGTDGRFYALGCRALLPHRTEKASRSGDTASYLRPEATRAIARSTATTAAEMAAVVRRDCIPEAAASLLEELSFEGMTATQVVRQSRLSGLLHDAGVSMHMLYDVVVALGRNHADHHKFGAASECLLAEMVIRTVRSIVRADMATAGTEAEEVAADRLNRLLHASLLKKAGAWDQQVLPILRRKFRAPDDFKITLTPPLVKHIAARLHGKGAGFAFDPAKNAFTGARGAQIGLTYFTLPRLVRSAVQLPPVTATAKTAAANGDDGDDTKSQAALSVQGGSMSAVFAASPSGKFGGAGGGDFETQSAISASASTVFARAPVGADDDADDDDGTTQRIAQRKQLAAKRLVDGLGGTAGLAKLDTGDLSVASLSECTTYLAHARTLCLLGDNEHADCIINCLVSRALAPLKEARRTDSTLTALPLAVEALLLATLMETDGGRAGAMLGHPDGLGAALARSLAGLNRALSATDAWAFTSLCRASLGFRAGPVDRIAVCKAALESAIAAERRGLVMPFSRCSWYFGLLTDYCKALSAVDDAQELRTAVADLRRGVDIPTIGAAMANQRRTAVLVVLRKAAASLVVSQNQDACKRLKDICVLSLRLHEERFGAADVQTGVAVSQAVYVVATACLPLLKREEGAELKRYHGFVVRFGTSTVSGLKEALAQHEFLHSLGVMTTALSRLGENFVAVRAMHHSVRFMGDAMRVKAVDVSIAALERRAKLRIRQMVLRRKNPAKLALLELEASELHRRAGVEVVEDGFQRARLRRLCLVDYALVGARDMMRDEELLRFVAIPEVLARAIVAADEAAMRGVFERWAVLSEVRSEITDQFEAQRRPRAHIVETFRRGLVEQEEASAWVADVLEPWQAAVWEMQRQAVLSDEAPARIAIHVSNEQAFLAEVDEGFDRSIWDMQEAVERSRIALHSVEDLASVQRIEAVVAVEASDRRELAVCLWREGYRLRRRAVDGDDVPERGGTDTARTARAKALAEVDRVKQEEDAIAERLARQAAMAGHGPSPEERLAALHQQRHDARVEMERLERRRERERLRLRRAEDEEGAERATLVGAVSVARTQLDFAERRERLRLQRELTVAGDVAERASKHRARVHAQERTALLMAAETARASIAHAESHARRRIAEAFAATVGPKNASPTRREDSPKRGSPSAGAKGRAISSPTRDPASSPPRMAAMVPAWLTTLGKVDSAADCITMETSHRNQVVARERTLRGMVATSYTAEGDQLRSLHDRRQRRRKASPVPASAAVGGDRDGLSASAAHRHPGSFEAVEARVRAERLSDSAAREEAQERRRQAALERMAGRRSASAAHADSLRKSADEAARLQSLAPDSSLGLLLSGRKAPSPRPTKGSDVAVSHPQQSRRTTAIAELSRQRPAAEIPSSNSGGPRSAGDAKPLRQQRDGRGEAGTPPPKMAAGGPKQRRSASVVAPPHSNTPGPVARKPRHHLAPLDAKSRGK